jgi:hypothetical protein
MNESSKDRVMAQQLETTGTLTKHKRPHLAKLLEAAKTCKHGPLKRYLEPGGTPDAVIVLQQPGNKIFKVPLLHAAVLNHHRDAQHAGSVEVLLSAGARKLLGTHPMAVIVAVSCGRLGCPAALIH